MKIAHLTDNNIHVSNSTRWFNSNNQAEKHTFFVFEKVTGNNSLIKVNMDTEMKFSTVYSETSKYYVLNVLPSFDLLILHGLSEHNIEMLNLLNTSDLVIMWNGWGYDYIELLFNKFSDALGEESKSLYFKMKSDKSFKETPYSLSLDKQNAIKKVDIFSPVLANEFTSIQNKHLCTRHLIFVDWKYEFPISINEISSFSSNVARREQIWVGNSSTILNNHLDYLKMVELNSKLKSITHVFPMSYGFENYRAQIGSAIDRVFGINKKIIVDFVGFSEYVRLISECKYMVMAHYRQQGVGNILIGLLTGVKVFIEPKNLMYQFFKDSGLYVYSLLELQNEVNVGELSEKEKVHNIKLISQMYSDVKFKQRLLDLKRLCSEIKIKKRLKSRG